MTHSRAFRLSSLALASALTLAACGADPTPAPTEQRSAKVRETAPFVAPTDAAALRAGDLAFAVDLHGKLRAAHAGENFIFSPTSITLALAMLYGGAAGNTATQMASALHFTLPPERLHPALDALDLALAAPPPQGPGDAKAFRLSIASSSWAQQGFAFQPSYLDLLAESYGAGVYTQDFAAAPEAARAVVNGWVSDHTERQIPELFPKNTIDSSTRLVLANAVFFHGDWQTPFASKSPDGTFHAPGGDVTVPMMGSGGQNALTWSGAGYEAASMRYAGGTTSMVVVVPTAGTFDAFEQGLTAASTAALLAPAQTTPGWVTMPRFKFATPTNLVEVLKSLGMTDAFSDAADFSGLSTAEALMVQAVVHQATIAVDEKGTTAAAATGVVVGPGSAPLDPKILVADRPFLFFVVHEGTGAVLFQGRVLDPSK
jgi:serpin B